MLSESVKYEIEICSNGASVKTKKNPSFCLQQAVFT